MYSKTRIFLLYFWICLWQINNLLAFPESKSLLPQPGQCARSTSPRIVGGELVEENEFPWMVFIRTRYTTEDGKHMLGDCSGSLINERYVVTAAHCIPEPNQGTFVFLGERNKTKFEQNALKIGATAIVHEEYDKNTHNNDIALLRLKDEIIYANSILPICLTEKPFEIFHVRTVEAVGWGDIDLNGTRSNDLKKLTMAVVEFDDCKQIHNKLIPSKLCTFAGCEHVSHGDSGGPIQWTSNGTYFLLGIVSTGINPPCKDEKPLPDISTRVSYFLDWIKKNIED